MFRFVSLCSGPCFALGRLHCPAAAGLRGCAMWRYVAPCRGPEISGGPGRISSGTAAGSAALSSHCFALGGIFFREPGRLPGAGARIRAGKGSVRAPGVPLTAAYCPGRGTGGPAVLRCLEAPIADAPRYQAVPTVAGGKGLRPRGRGSADPALVGVGLAFLRRLNPFVVGGVERVHSRWVRRADRREGRGGDTRAPQR